VQHEPLEVLVKWAQGVIRPMRACEWTKSPGVTVAPGSRVRVENRLMSLVDQHINIFIYLLYFFFYTNFGLYKSYPLKNNLNLVITAS
jgi:hypothetical protein